MAPPVASELDRRIRIQESFVTTNPFGSPVLVWFDLLEAWAERRDLSATERWSGNQQFALRTSAFFTRFIPGLDSTMRLISDGIIYAFTGIAEVGRREGVQITTDVDNIANNVVPALVDFGADNGATPDRHYLIADVPVLEVAAGAAGAWGFTIRLGASDLAGMGRQAVLSNSDPGVMPSLNIWVNEASAAVPNSVTAQLCTSSACVTLTSAPDVIAADELLAVAVTYDDSVTPAVAQLVTCVPAAVPVVQATDTLAAGGALSAALAWHVGRFATTPGAEYYRGELAALWKANRLPTTTELRAIGAGVISDENTIPENVFDGDTGGLWAWDSGPDDPEPDESANNNDADRIGTWPS